MKRRRLTPVKVSARISSLWFLLILLSFTLVSWAPVYAQDTTQTESTEKEAESILKSKMSLTADQFADGTIGLNGLLRAKIEGSYQKVPGRKVAFFRTDAEGNEVPMGDTLTDANGIASLRFDKKTVTPGADGSYAFICRYDGDDKMNGSESDLMIKPALLTMEPVAADSTYSLRLQAVAESGEGPQPIPGATVAVYVKRMFSSLKVGEGETDESGMVEVEFPAGLAGDQEGNLAITASIDETDEYGNLKATTVQKWGKPISYEIKELPEALWSGHPPVWMIVTFFVLMTMVWGNYAAIVFKLFRIKADKSGMEAKH